MLNYSKFWADAMSDNSNMLGYLNCFERYCETQSVLIHNSVGIIKPLVSIMIPTYRRPELLREAIASAMDQVTSLMFEVVVVDNEPDPEMAVEVNDVVRSFKASNLYLYRNEKNIGMFGNWNRCIELASADWVSILNDDDMLKRDFLETAWNAKSGNSMVACGVEYFGSIIPATSRVKSSFRSIYRYLIKLLFYRNGARKISVADALKGNPVNASLGVLFSKKSAIALGGYNESHWPASDYVFNVRYWNNFGAIILADILACCRIEINETLKVNTLEGFIKQGLPLKREIVKNLIVCCTYKKLLYAMSSLQIELDASRYQLFYNSKFNAKYILSRFDLFFRGFRFIVLRNRLLEYAWYILAGYIKNNMHLESRKAE